MFLNVFFSVYCCITDDVFGCLTLSRLRSHVFFFVAHYACSPLFFVTPFALSVHNISDFGETIRFSVLLVALLPFPLLPLSVAGFITDMWSRDIIPWEMSIVSCAALLWWKNLSE